MPNSEEVTVGGIGLEDRATLFVKDLGKFLTFTVRCPRAPSQTNFPVPVQRGPKIHRRASNLLASRLRD